MDRGAFTTAPQLRQSRLALRDKDRTLPNHVSGVSASVITSKSTGPEKRAASECWPGHIEQITTGELPRLSNGRAINQGAKEFINFSLKGSFKLEKSWALEAMPRYYFDLWRGNELIQDHEGTDMPGPNAAKDEVRETLGQLAKEELMQANPSRELRVMAKDGAKPIFQARLHFDWEALP